MARGPSIKYSNPTCGRCRREVPLKVVKRGRVITFVAECHGAMERVSFGPGELDGVTALIGTTAFAARAGEEVDLSC